MRASQEKEDKEDEKLDLVQMTREMHICLHEESNEIMKWTEANKGNKYNIEKKRYASKRLIRPIFPGHA